MERGSLISKAMYASRELPEILRCFGDDVIVELEGDASSRFVVDGDVELGIQEIQYFNGDRQQYQYHIQRRYS